MEPMIGTASFSILCLQVAAASEPEEGRSQEGQQDQQLWCCFGIANIISINTALASASTTSHQ
jgi:hypothetical protein